MFIQKYAYYNYWTLQDSHIKLQFWLRKYIKLQL